MLCEQPYLKGVMPYACGRCIPCRIARRRLWTHRMMLEALCHPFSSFLTLTYADMPPGGSLVPRDLKLFLMRLRTAFGPYRYYAVGEYGDRSWRPHYHASLFGVPATAEDLVRKCWGLGHVYLVPFERKTAQYVAGYCTKKLTKPGSEGLNGRHPEFARMSRKPGLGARLVPNLAEALNTSAGSYFVTETGDVPLVLQHGPSKFPIGRYLRRKLREEMGFESPKTPPEILAQRVEEMCSLREAAGGPIAYRLKTPFIEFDRKTQVLEKSRRFPKVSKL